MLSIESVGFMALSLVRGEKEITTLHICSILLLIVGIAVGPSITKRLKAWQFTMSYYKYQICVTGYESHTNSGISYEYPLQILAISRFIFSKNLSKQYKVIDSTRNGIHDTYCLSKTSINDSKTRYVLDDTNEITLGNNMFLKIHRTESSYQTSTTSSGYVYEYHFIVGSNIISVKKIEEFLSKCLDEYEQSILDSTRNKLYHFIYQGYNTEREKTDYSVQILSDKGSETNTNFETFDTMVGDNKAILINDLDRLHDLEYYKEKGLRRKKGYLFYGPPGCGKTSHVMAMANHDQRHILEIPLSRVKTAQQFENILNLKEINGIPICKEHLIYLFDEIDISLQAMEEKKNIHTKDKALNKFIADVDVINLDTLLSRLDGIGSYQGMVIVATTNRKNNLPPALCRHGRLTPILFDLLEKEKIEEMIEMYYKVKLTKSQKVMIKGKKAPSELQYMFESRSLDSLLKLICRF
jgi:ATP-dependent 26S proteasome regulatory subunit